MISLVSESLFKSQIESIFVHFKLCNAHHLFLLTEKKKKCSLIINLSNKCIMISKFYCNRLLTCSCVTITYSVCVNSGGVVETSDVCLDCPTVIDRDVDLNRLLHRCLEKKLQGVECFLFFFILL